jgi:putative hydrolase of HD superfamily
MSEPGASEIQAIIRLAYEAGHLKRLPRAGWLLAGIKHPESVAEHSFRVALLAYLIGQLEGADAEHAAVLGLFHDLPETRTGDVPSVGRSYVRTADPREVVADQVEGLPPRLAAHVGALIAEHESAKLPDPSQEARCSRDADKLDCLLQAREYQAQGSQLVQPWIDTMAAAVTTHTAMTLAGAAQKMPPSAWWDEFATSFGSTPRPPER